MKKTHKKMGRPTKYKKIYCKKIVEYFDIPHTKQQIAETRTLVNGQQIVKTITVANDFPTIEGFSGSLKVSKDTVHAWISRYKEFADAYKRAKDLQLAMYQANTLRGYYNPMFAIFAGKNIFGWTDKIEQQVTGKDGKPMELRLVTYKEGKK